MERFKYLISRFGMLIPFAIAVICILAGWTIASYVFAGIFAVWLVSWLVRVGINWWKTKKEIEAADKK